ncbi:MAG TPA: DUF6636 domain-containing protein [Gaiellaceae bacterium]|nr:DUF6636 domain-containing protein [Gaiellaceae bacterium]
MLRLAVVLALGVGLASSIGVASVGSSASASDYFVTPSRNIICAWHGPFEPETRPSLRCDIRSGLDPRPRRPADCDTDWALGVAMLSTGTASVLCAGDSIWRGWKPVLGYGTAWRKRGFTCRSREIGLTCTNTSGHGFFLSRESWRRIKPRSR